MEPEPNPIGHDISMDVQPFSNAEKINRFFPLVFGIPYQVVAWLMNSRKSFFIFNFIAIKKT